jgi:hypothetical protein
MKKIILRLIKIYQKTISPIHGSLPLSFIIRKMSFLFPDGMLLGCRFHPSCSQYAYQAITRYGLIKGGLKSIWRILRCNPLSRGGIDPL